jgi:hypothetical protein
MSQNLEAKTVGDAMFQIVANRGEKKVKPQDLIQAMHKKYGKECTRALCNDALRLLISPERCVYHSGGHSGGCYITLASG